MGIPAVDRGAGRQFGEKNAAMAAFGGEVVTAGKDFDDSRRGRRRRSSASAAIISCRPFTATW